MIQRSETSLLGGRGGAPRGCLALPSCLPGDARGRPVHATPTGRIVVLRKENTTPDEYPRVDGEPKRKPLGVTKRS